MKLLILAALAASIASAAVAAVPPAKARPMDLANLQSRHWAQIQRADTNGDGKISKAEFIAMAQAKGHGDHAEKAWSRMDVDGDGFLSQAEADKLAARRFSRLDADHDGTVSPTERQAGHAAHAGMVR